MVNSRQFVGPQVAAESLLRLPDGSFQKVNQEPVVSARIEAFLNEYDALCRKHLVWFIIVQTETGEPALGSCAYVGTKQ